MSYYAKDILAIQDLLYAHRQVEEWATGDVGNVRVVSLQPCVLKAPQMRVTTFIIRKYWVRNVTHVFNTASLICWFFYEGYAAPSAKQRGKAGHIWVPLVN